MTDNYTTMQGDERDPLLDGVAHHRNEHDPWHGKAGPTLRSKLCLFVLLVLLPIAFLATGLQFPATELLHKLQGRVRVRTQLSQRPRNADVLARWAVANNLTLDTLEPAGSHSREVSTVAEDSSTTADQASPAPPAGRLSRESDDQPQQVIPRVEPRDTAASRPVAPASIMTLGTWPPTSAAAAVLAPATEDATPNSRTNACTFRKDQSASQCYDKLTNFLAVSRSAARWMFLGDSTMSHLFHQFRSGVKSKDAGTRNCERSKPVAGGCELLAVIGLQKPTGGWIKPDRTKEGPKSAKPYCTDCGGCKPSVAFGLDCAGADGASFLPVEFARDREHPTREGGPTSQETVAYFLSQNPWDVCVVNSGVHDMALKGLTDEQYLANVQFWLQTLLNSKGCGRIVWLQTSSVRGPDPQGNDQHGNPYRYPQNNARLRVWNDMVAALLISEFSQHVFEVDIWDASVNDFEHGDNVHMKRGYYNALAQLFKDS